MITIFGYLVVILTVLFRSLTKHGSLERFYTIILGISYLGVSTLFFGSIWVLDYFIQRVKFV
jgi:hypothetical protein